MTIKEIIVGHRVLVQSGAEIREHALIKGINMNNGLVIVKLSNGEIAEMNPMYILKDFGS